MIALTFRPMDGLDDDGMVAEVGAEIGGHAYVASLTREMRLDPFPGMKQPILNSAIMGYETILHVKADGKPLPNCRWYLYNGTRLVQRGRTDREGRSGELSIWINLERQDELRLELRPRQFRSPS